MVATFDNAAVVHDHDDVRVDDGGQTMGDYEDGAAGHEAVQAFLHHFFGPRVDG